MDKDLESLLLGIAVIKGSWSAARKYLEEVRNFANTTALIMISKIEEHNPEVKLPWYDTNE